MKITVDYREDASGIIDLLKEKEVLIEVKKVSFGDYIINDSIAIERKTARDFLISIIDGRLFSQWHIPVVFSHSKEDTRDILLMMGRQNEAYIDVVPLRGGYRPKRLKSKQLYLLQGLPQIGPMLAKRLIEHFKSIVKIMNASIEELAEVEGIGRVSAERIYA